jgi:hypothetical protein
MRAPHDRDYVRTQALDDLGASAHRYHIRRERLETHEVRLSRSYRLLETRKVKPEPDAVQNVNLVPRTTKGCGEIAEPEGRGDIVRDLLFSHGDN